MQTAARILLSMLCCLAVGVGRAAAQDPIDVVLVLDNSGSMRANDPSRLMPVAVATFASRLPPESRAGLVVFDGRVRVPLDLMATADSGFAAAVDHSLLTIDYSGARTDIPGAVERAIYTLRTQGRPRSRRALILFTDGIVDLGDIGRDAARRTWLHTRITQEAIEERVSIFGIAFTEDADFQLIQSLSHDTNGAHFRIERASQVAEVFNEISSRLLARVAPALPMALPAQATRWTQYRTAGGAALITIAVIGLGFWIGSARRRPVPVRATLTAVSSIPEVMTINRHVTRIGRQSKVGFRRHDLVIDDRRVSKRHAEIKFRRGQFYLRDNGSLNGTFIGSEEGTLARLQPRKWTPIGKASRIVFCGHEYVFDCASLGSPRRLTDETEIAASLVVATCNVCRRAVDRETLSAWQRFAVCPSCRDEIDQLSTHQAGALERQIERYLREAVTQRM